MRPQDVVPASASRNAAGGELGAQASSASRAAMVASQPSISPAMASAARGNGPTPSRAAASRRCDGVGARRRQGHAVAGHGVLERGEPVRIAAALGQQARALAQRILVGGDVAGMLGMQRRHQPVEEAPALARPVEEQPVQLRRQPDGRDMLAKRGLALAPAGRRCARPAAAGCLRSWPAPGRCRWRAGPPAYRAWQRPPRKRHPARRRGCGGRPRPGGPGAGRGRAPGRRAPPAGWSCRRRWRRPARRARGRNRGGAGGSCGSRSAEAGARPVRPALRRLRRRENRRVR